MFADMQISNDFKRLGIGRFEPDICHYLCLSPYLEQGHFLRFKGAVSVSSNNAFGHIADFLIAAA